MLGLARRRCLSTRPWFVDPELVRQPPPHILPRSHDLPPELPVPVKDLFRTLSRSPFLESSTLEVKKPSIIPPGPPLPKSIPKGRRGRGRTYSGEGIGGDESGIWNWFVVAQVKEGTENRGSIEAVVRLVRKTLLKMHPPVHLPPNAKRRGHHGWAMVDAGDFAIHILSREARQKQLLHAAQDRKTAEAYTTNGPRHGRITMSKESLTVHRKLHEI